MKNITFLRFIEYLIQNKDNPEFIEYDERPTILAASGDYIGTISIADTKRKR